MVKIKELLKRYKEGKCTVKEQMCIRIAKCLIAVIVLVTISAVMDLIIWLRPVIEGLIYIAVPLVLIYETGYILWYVQIWAYGDVKSDARKYYPYIQNAIFTVVQDIYNALGVVRPSGKSAVSSIGQKTFTRGNRVIYQYNLLLKDLSDTIAVEDVKKILQTELLRKSEEGFDGITFISGYPYLQVDSVLVDGSYLQVQIVVLWNEAQKNTYEAEQEQKRVVHSDIVMVDDEVF